MPESHEKPVFPLEELAARMLSVPHMAPYRQHTLLPSQPYHSFSGDFLCVWHNPRFSAEGSFSVPGGLHPLAPLKCFC